MKYLKLPTNLPISIKTLSTHFISSTILPKSIYVNKNINSQKHKVRIQLHKRSCNLGFRTYFPSYEGQIDIEHISYPFIHLTPFDWIVLVHNHWNHVIEL